MNTEGSEEAERRDDAAPGAVQAPAEPDRELHRLGSRDRARKVQRVHEGALVEPAADFDEPRDA